jgi:iron complex outermembrane receptor protein
MPITDQLMADVAFRSSDYNLSGRSDTSRFGLTYVVNDMLKFRVGINEAERAPSVDNYYRPQSRSLWTGADPCANSEETGLPVYTAAECANTGVTSAQYGNITASPASQYYNIIGGNKDLKPELADTVTAGVVFEVYGIQASVDYWSIEIEDAIGTIDEETILELCAKQGQYCDLITRNAAGSLWLTGGSVDQRLQNLSERKWEGVDISAATSFDMWGGTVDVKTTAANVMDKTTILVPGNTTGTYDCTGVISNNCFPTPEWRTRTSVTYSTGDNWTAGLTVRTMSGMDNDYAPDLIAQEAVEDAYNLLDVNFTYEINENLMVRAHRFYW